jgi:hypothetical protein
MAAANEAPDPRFLAGVVLFNEARYFDAHEVWEELWHDCPAADRRFVQSLIQAAVSLYHWGNRNRAGADRLFHSGRRYMDPYRPAYFGLDVDRFWEAMDAREFSAPPGPPPIITLDPPPHSWPDPAAFLDPPVPPAEGAP